MVTIKMKQTKLSQIFTRSTDIPLKGLCCGGLGGILDVLSPSALVVFFLSGNGGGVLSWSLVGTLLALTLSIIDVLLNVFLRDGISGREVFGCVDFTDDRVS